MSNGVKLSEGFPPIVPLIPEIDLIKVIYKCRDNLNSHIKFSFKIKF